MLKSTPRTAITLDSHGQPVALASVVEMRPRRHLMHPHPLANGKDMHRHEMPDEGATREPRPSYISKGHDEAVERNVLALAQLFPDAARDEVAIYDEKIAQGKRPKYAALETHKEMAVFRLAAGATFEEAADYAGVTAQTVARYYEDPEVRARIDEMKSLSLAQTNGLLVEEIARRVRENRTTMETADVIRLFDRTQPLSARPTTGTQKSDAPETKYDQIVNVIIAAANDGAGRAGDRPGSGEEPRLVGSNRRADDAGAVEGTDTDPERPAFPVIRVERPAVAGGGA